MKKIFFSILILSGIAQAQVINIPDPNFKNRLILLGIDSNADGEIQQSEAIAVTDMVINNANIVDITGIEAFINLEYLDCKNNQITVLNLSSFTGLKDLYCENNLITSLNFAGLNLENVVIDNNPIAFDSLDDLIADQLISLSAAGCTSLIYFAPNPTPSLQNLNLAGCTNIGASLVMNAPNLITADISYTNIDFFNIGGTNNLLESLNIAGCTSLSDIGVNNCKFTTFDVSALPNLASLQINNNLLTSLFIKNGGAEIIGINGNPNLIFICADEAEVGAVQQQLSLMGSLNTTVHSYCTFTPGGDYNIISGIIQYDLANNGCDNLDPTQSLIKININDGTSTGSAFTDVNGSYLFYTLAGNFTLSPDLEIPSYFTLSQPSQIVNFATVNNNTATADFCIVPNGIHADLEIVIAPIIPARPGFDAVYKIVYKNKGNQVHNGMVTFNFDNTVMEFISAFPIQNNQLPGSLTFLYSDLLPFENREIIVTMNINSPTDSPAVNINDQLDFTATIALDVIDDDPSDNLFDFHQIVIGSYDPNDISCIEGDVISPSEIGNFLHYIINFENTGTDFAQNIVVQDIINTDQFDLASLQLLNASHNVTARLQDNIIEFIFQDINLQIGGHGNILLKIKSKNNLVVGDTVSKQANIFFDYNYPVETNIASTTFQSLGIASNNFDNTISVYPNPVTDVINIKSSSNITSIHIYDVQGRLLQNISNNDTAAVLDISAHMSGIYFVRVTSEKGTKTEKIIKE